MSFSPSSGAFHLTYLATKGVRAPTVLFVPTQVHYPNGYCLSATGARVVSGIGTDLVELANRPSARTVSVVLRAGACSR
jgi:hypothetical protein